MALQIGRKGQLYLKKEAAYGTEQALAVTNALRHLDVGFGFDPFARVTSPEKKQSPGPVNRLDRKKTAELGTLVSLLRPSGVLNTVAEIDPVLEAGFGAVTNETLSTTVASAPTTTGATVASAGTLAVGDAVLLEVTGETDGPYVRFLTAVSGSDLTWAPALPSAQTVGDDVKGGITYKLTTALAVSLTIAHYLDNFTRQLLGAGVDELSFAFDANEEGQVTASGPAKEQTTGTTQSQPAGFTTLGGNPPSGLVGDCLIGDTVYLVKSIEVSITNGLAVRNQEYGVNGASELYRSTRREISVSLDAFAETEATLYDLAEAGTLASMFKQTGRTEGNIIAVYAPRVDWKVPEQDDPDEEVSWSHAGVALETADGLNDELRLALM